MHLIPQLGSKRLDAITSEDVQHLKNHLREKAPKTVNNVLTVLNTLLKQAVEWNVIARHPCTIRLLPIHKGSARFHDFDEYERLVAAAKSTDARAYLIVLLGGEAAGLRCGEMMALAWTEVDLAKRQLCVQRSDWKGQVTAPKSGRLRYVPLTIRLAVALRDHHLRGTVRAVRRGRPSVTAARVVWGRVSPENPPRSRSAPSMQRFAYSTADRSVELLETLWRRPPHALKSQKSKGKVGCGGGMPSIPTALYVVAA